MEPARSVRNIRFPSTSRAIPIASIRCVTRISGAGRLPEVASIGARLTVFPRGGALPFRKVRARPEDAAESRVVGALLCPVELPPSGIDAHADAPLGRVATA